MNLGKMETRIERLEERLGGVDQAPFWLLVLVAMRPANQSQDERDAHFIGFKSAQGDGKCWHIQEGETREQLEARIEAEAKAEGRTSLMVTECHQEVSRVD